MRAVSILLCLCLGITTFALDITTKDGTTYKDVKLLKHSKVGYRFKHSAGEKFVSKRSLTKESRQALELLTTDDSAPAKPAAQTPKAKTQGENTAPANARFTISTEPFLTFAKYQKEGPVNIFAFASKRSARGTACAFVVSEIDVSNQRRKPTLEEVIELSGNAAKTRYTSFQVGKISRKDINGMTFAVQKWKATLNGLQMDGYFYGTKKAGIYFNFQIQDVKPDSAKSLPTCLKIIETFRLK